MTPPTLRSFRRRIAAALGLTLGLCVALTSAAVSARGLVRDAEIERTVRRLADPIFVAAGLPPASIEIFIVGDKSLNAFVDGGRNMFLNTGLLLTLERAEEVMGVIAHESGHITGGHIVRRIEAVEAARIQSIVASVVGIGAAAAGGGVGGVAVGGGGAALAQRELLKFTRGQEASADQAALDYMTRAGVDPTALLDTLERLIAQQSVYLAGVDPYLLSHPLGQARIDFLRQGVSRSPALGRGVDDDTRYWHARMRAKLDGFIGAIGGAASVRYADPELALYREAIALHRLPAPDRAVEAVDRLIAMRPSDPYYWELKGQILLESGRAAQAVEPYRRATALAPDEPLIRAGLGGALLALEQPETDREALEMLEQAALEEPFDPGLRRPLALAYARAGDDGMAAVVTGERLALQGRIADAKVQAERAKRLLPVGSPGWLRAEDLAGLRDPDE